MNGYVQKIRRSQLAPRVALALGVFVAISIWEPNFLTEGNMYTVLEGSSLVGLVALGVGITIIAGEFDLSVGSVAAVAGILAIQLGSLGLWPAIAIAMVASAIFGAAQGYALVRLNMSSLVFTIATSIAVRGLAFIISDETTVLAKSLNASAILREKYAIFSIFSLITIAAFIVFGIFLTRTRLGREIYAIGGGRAESRGAGVRETRPLVLAFAISAGLAGLAGAIASSKSASAQPNAYEELLLPAVTAALIGGVSLRGGIGSVIGIALGTFTLRCLISGLDLQGAAFYIESLATGALLLIVLAIEMAGKSWEEIRFLFDKRSRPRTGRVLSPP